MPKLVWVSDVDWTTIPAKDEKEEEKVRQREWPVFWDAEEGGSEAETVGGIFCDALDHFFIDECTDSTEIQGQWQ